MAMPNYDPQVSNNLFRDYQAGNDQALSELYQLWQPYIKNRVIRSKIPARETDDLVHDVFLRVVADASKWNIETAGWWKFLDFKIKKAVSEYYRVLNTFKRQAVVNTQSIDENLDDPDDYYAPLADDQPPAINFLIFQDRLQAVQAAILKCGFPDQVQTILEMRFADHDYAVISERIGVERDRVKKLLYAAIREIRKHLVTD